MPNTKTVKRTSKECQAHHVVSRLAITSSKEIPIIHYPNNYICWEATDWLLDLWQRGKKPNTLDSYAYTIAPFIRYLFQEKRIIKEVNDDFLYKFAKHLDENGKKSNRIRAIISRVITFFMWLKTNSYIPKNVIAIDDPDSEIRLTMKTYVDSKAYGKKFHKSYLYHSSMPAKEAVPKRRAITNVTIDALLEEIENLNTAFRKERDKALLNLLEHSGGRRVELHRVKIDDIYRARDTGRLKLYSAKKRNISNPSREVPICKEVTEDLIQFITYERQEHINTAISKGRLKKDHEYLLINTHGIHMAVKSISDEIAYIRRSAGISEKAHAHLFRHRFITILLNDIHNTLIDMGIGDIADSVRNQLMSILGWSVDMTPIYEDQLLSEKEGWKRIEKAFLSRLSDEHLQRELTSHMARLNSGLPLSLNEQEDLLCFLTNLLSRAHSHNP